MLLTSSTVATALPRLAATLAMLTAAALMWGCGDGQDRGIAHAETRRAVAVDVAPAKQDIDQIGGALRDLRDARSDVELQQRYPSVRLAANALAMSLSTVAAQYEATVAAGQSALSSNDQADPGRPSARAAQRSPAESDLALAMDSLLMCRSAYGQVSSAYQAQLLQLTRSLDRDHTRSGIQAATPTIAGLLEDQSELRSILTDISAKSKAVMTEIAMTSGPR